MGKTLVKLRVMFSSIVIYTFLSDNNIADGNGLYTHATELTFKRTVSSPAMRHNIAPRSNHLISDETRGIFIDSS